MHCLVVYDISDDAKRTKVADICLDYGLDRIQYSAFLGDLPVTHQEELMLRVKKALGRKPGNIQLFPLCAKDWQGRQAIVNAEPAKGLLAATLFDHRLAELGEPGGETEKGAGWPPGVRCAGLNCCGPVRG